MTVEGCVKECFLQSFTIAGLEYAQECCELYFSLNDVDGGLIGRFFHNEGCGNVISSPGAPIAESACNQACVGDSTEVCGGPNALQVYQSS